MAKPKKLKQTITAEQKQELTALLEEKARRLKFNRIGNLFPETGKYSRHAYPKHMQFLAAGKTFRQRGFIAGVRTGKTLTASYEVTCHLTGDYPTWWEGKRFDRPTNGWSCALTTQKAKEVNQLELLGPKGEYGTGLIPQDRIVRVITKPGSPDGIEGIDVRHKDGGISRVQFKSYEQGTDSFVGTAIDFAHLDEEPPLDVYTQVLMRTATTEGIVLCTFTPIHSITEVVKMFLMPESYDGVKSTKFVVMCAWDDVPHLTTEAKAELLQSIPPYQRDAISKGLPQLGRGAIYPVSESVFLIDDFQIPRYWPRLYAMDVGWNATAAVWLAWDRESDIVYLYSEYLRGQAEPSIHADAIRARGQWIRGLIDPAARGRSQADGVQLYSVYRDLGLNITLANNAVEAGIHTVFQRLSTGRLRIFKTCKGILDEIRIYRRDDNGRVVKEDDHRLDCMRYGIMGLGIADTEPSDEVPITSISGRNSITGY